MASKYARSTDKASRASTPTSRMAAHGGYLRNEDVKHVEPRPARRRIRLASLGGSPYLSAVNPAADELHTKTIEWARAMGLVRKPEHIKKLDDSQVGHLVARVFPKTTNLGGLQLAVDWTTLFCCLDDYLEQIRGAVLTAAYLRSLLKVFRDGEDPRLTDPFAHGFRDLRERMLELKVPNWIPRFIACIERLFDAFVDEAKYRTIGVTPEFASYRQIRQITVGLYSGFLLREVTDTVVLSPEVLAHEHVRALERTASDIVGLANDIMTAEKEMGAGEVNNTVLVLMQEDHLSFDQAMARTHQLYEAELRDFRRLKEELPTFGDAETDEQLRRYADFLSTFITGHHAWAARTGRYTAVQAPIADDDDDEEAIL